MLVLCSVGCDIKTNKSDVMVNNLSTSFQNSKTTLTDFVNQWSQESLELQSDQLTDLEREIHEIYKVVYSPFEFERYGWTNWNNWTPYMLSSYIVIQQEIPFVKTDKIDTINFNYHYKDTLRNFTPNVHFKNVTNLYLTPTYQNVFKNFLGDPVNENEREIFREKKDFLKRALPISFGYNWRVILTHPLIDGICITNDFKKATVEFTLLQSGLRSFLVKENDAWKIASTKTIWIE